MKHSPRTLRNFSAWGLLAIAIGTFVILVLRCFLPADLTRYLELTIESEQRDVFELYWAEGEGYSPKRQGSREIFPDDSPVTFRIPLPNENITHFRLDPVVEKGTLRLLQTAYGEARTGVWQELDLSLWKPRQAIGSLELTDQGLWIVSEEGAADPQLQMEYSLPKVIYGVQGLLSPGGAILILVALCGWWRLRKEKQYVDELETGIGYWNHKAGLQWLTALLSFGVIGALAVPALSWFVHESYRERAFFEIDLYGNHNIRNGGDEQALTQLFFDSGNGFWHGDSVTRTLASTTTRETLRFYLNAETIYELRFDPLNGAFAMEIFGARLGSTKGTLNRSLDLANIHPRHQIAVFERREDSLYLKSTEDANDPQLKINLTETFSSSAIRRWDIPGPAYGFWLGIALAFPFLTLVALRNVRESSDRSGGLLAGWASWFHGRPGRRLAIVILSVLMVLAVGARILAVYAVYPGDAPDERAHMGLIVAISDGQLLSVDQEFPMTGYAFSIYNPLAYLPSVFALNTAWGWADQDEPQHSRDAFLGKLEELGTWKEAWNHLDPVTRPSWYDYLEEQEFSGHSQFSFKTTYLARWGNLFWALAYLVMIPLVIRPYRNSEKILLVGLLAFTPQILFVQSYVNLDSMGLFVSLYLFWAVREERWRHAAVACLLTAFCKMNFYCIYFLPAVYLFFRYPWQWKLWFQRSLLLFLPSFIVLVVWNWYTHAVINTGMVGGALSIAALYGVEPGGSRVFQWPFLRASLDSAFGLFGYLYQPVPIRWAYPLWKFVLVPVGLIALLVTTIRNRPCCALFKRSPCQPSGEGALAMAVLAVLVVNVFIHYYASYGNNGYSPQGRYFFGTMVMFFCYWPLATRWLKNGLAPLRWLINVGLALLFFFFSFYSLKDMNYHETLFGFSADWTSDEEPMENLWERIEPYYPY